ncbi:hypothetical protein EVC45_10440 [Paraburkholderia sp. UYCP14C]|uniref:hypothetical protein n=1 Tax=Paraburkholderia sp. UYCP14C TaxID=2511130 RepID=UPI0010201A11|nr:hypothetical protein [Paraburkholderia sp. UYCP14C]RZF30003.1 hypothetical protein EVC45_10440 [Paraburkholderia sp. UYCP14C]
MSVADRPIPVVESVSPNVTASLESGPTPPASDLAGSCTCIFDCYRGENKRHAKRSCTRSAGYLGNNALGMDQKWTNIGVTVDLPESQRSAFTLPDGGSMPELRLNIPSDVISAINDELKIAQKNITGGTGKELSATDIGRDALAVYKWVVDQTAKGKTVVATDSSLDTFVQISTPNLPAPTFLKEKG